MNLAPQTPALYQGGNMGDLLIDAIQRGGERVAFVHAERQTTYREFGELVSRMVQALTAHGLAKGDPVATLSTNRPEAFLVTAAAYLMGLRVTWLNPNSSEDDHVYMLRDSGVLWMLVDPPHYGDRALALQARVGSKLRMAGLGPWEGRLDMLAEAARFRPERLVARASADDVCVLMYTGGTTGQPKGVVHTHRVHEAMVLMELAGWDWPAEPRFLATTPITHASGTIIMPVLLRSGTFIMQSGFEVGSFCRLVEQHRVNATFMVPTMIYVLLDSPLRRQHDLSSLAMVIYGAAPMAPTRLTEAIGVFGPVFMQIYGQSEAPMALTVLHAREHEPERQPQRLASCGTPMAGIQLRLLDERGVEVADGEVGEICARGPLVMAGYWNKPQETAAALRHGWLYTGDLARRDADGYLYIVDRSKDMIISGGFNVFPREVEDVLSQHPAVAAAGVVGVPDPKWGEAVHAMVVLRPGAGEGGEAGSAALGAELMALVRLRKGAVQTPKHIAFVAQLPVTTLGKIDKKAMRDHFARRRADAVG
ncbi:MAG: AMP-binding protein [Burkholderiales bacterium]|nr:AMP-binding protein [Burkholderiales bacterium]